MRRYEDHEVARVVHEANAALQCIHGDTAPSTRWDAETQEVRDSAAEGVRLVRRGATPRELHASWCDAKRALGWTYGAEKDFSAKTHPCLVSYDDLPPAQRDKDRMFWAITLALTVDL
jgi:hypothetical protein